MSKDQKTKPKNKKPPKEIVLPLPVPDEIKPPIQHNQSLDVNSMLDEITYKKYEPNVDDTKKEVI